MESDRGEHLLEYVSVEPTFAALARQPDPPLDALALALAAELRPVDREEALGRLDALGEEVAQRAAEVARTPEAEAAACAEVLGGRHDFRGSSVGYGHPDHSMLDLVLASRRGLPIVLSVLYAEVARRAGIPLAGVGLRGHFVVGHFEVEPPLLLDPFAGGAPLPEALRPSVPHPWGPHEIALRMLNNLVNTYSERADLGRALRAAELRLALPMPDGPRRALRQELRVMRARFN